MCEGTFDHAAVRPGSILAILDHGIVDIPRHCSTRLPRRRSSCAVHSAGFCTSGAKCMDHLHAREEKEPEFRVRISQKTAWRRSLRPYSVPPRRTAHTYIGGPGGQARAGSHRFLHCVPPLSVLRSWAISDQCFGPRSSTSGIRRWSSSALHGLGGARAGKAEREPARSPCVGGRRNLSARPIEDSLGDAALCAALQPPREDAALSASE